MLEPQSLNRKRSGVRNMFGKTCSDGHCPEYLLDSVCVKWQIMAGWFVMPHETRRRDAWSSLCGLRCNRWCHSFEYAEQAYDSWYSNQRTHVNRLYWTPAFCHDGFLRIIYPAAITTNVKKDLCVTKQSFEVRFASLSWRVVMEILGVVFALRAKRWTGWHRGSFLFKNIYMYISTWKNKIVTFGDRKSVV